MVFLEIIAIVFLCLFLGILTGKLVRSTERFIRYFKVGSFEASAVIIALATSLPEILVSLSASFRGMGGLAVGNAIGSNIVNLSLIMGITAVAGSGLNFTHRERLRENIWSLGYTLTPFLTLVDLRVSRIEGLLLVILYGLYVYWLSQKQTDSQEKIKNESGKISIIVLRIFVWAALLVGVSQLIVSMAAKVAGTFNIPELIVGLFIVAVGTSLPELLFNLQTIKERKVSMSLGNLVGSCVANATLVIGLSALINPIVLSRNQTIMPTGEYIFILLILMRFIYSKHKLSAKEGWVLIALFVYYSIVELFLG